MYDICKARDVMTSLYVSPDISNCRNGRINNCTHQFVGRIKAKIKKVRLSLIELLELSDSELKQLFYPKLKVRNGYKRGIDYAYCYQELTKKNGKTKAQLYTEYVAVEAETAYKKTQFYFYLRQYMKACKLSMRQQHRAGEVVYIDYAGTRIKYLVDGKPVWVKVFVACLGASQKIFAFATQGETTRDWLDGMTRMFEYYGGVTQEVSMDNAKALVTKPGKIALLTRNIQLFGEYYGCLLDTCRVGGPQDKSLVENSVRYVKQRVLIPMNSDHTFFSIEEINKHLAIEVEKLNNAKIQKLKLSRNELFNNLEKHELRTLPKQKFQIIVHQSIVKVPTDYHIEYAGHYYSVPYTLAHKKVEVLVNFDSVTIFFEHKKVAAHPIDSTLRGQSTLTEHLAPNHKADLSFNYDYFVEWASNISPVVADYIVQLYQGKSPQSRALSNSCLGLQKLCKDKGEQAFIQACQTALACNAPPSEIRIFISARSVSNDQPEYLPHMHQNIRGPEYYGGHYEN